MTTPLIDALFGDRPAGRIAKPDEALMEEMADQVKELTEGGPFVDPRDEPIRPDDEDFEYDAS